MLKNKIITEHELFISEYVKKIETLNHDLQIAIQENKNVSKIIDEVSEKDELIWAQQQKINILNSKLSTIESRTCLFLKNIIASFIRVIKKYL